MKAWEFLTEAPAAPTAPVAPAQPAAPAKPAATTPVAAEPAGQQPFKPTQVMDPQQAAAANKAAQDFMAQLTAKLQGLVSAQPTNEQRLTEGWLSDKLKAALDWVTDALKSNPLIEIGLRLIPATTGVMAIWDCIKALRSGSTSEALHALARAIGGPAGEQLAQAAQGIDIGSAVASGDLAGAARQTASAAGLKDVASGIAAGQVAQAVSETAELNRILKLSGMELIAESSTKSVTVQRGDTLGRIARDNSTTVDAIVKLNNIANPDRIYPGDVIRIPGGQGDPGGRAKRQAQSPAPDIDSDTDTDSDNTSRVERAWLNMIAREESSDDYNAINFEAKKAMKKGTMRITGKPGQHPFDGQSGVTAAGRYQMLYNTWKTAAKLAGVDPNDFSPKNQDRAAFALAKNEYKRKYNRDLITDLQDPKRVDQAVRGSTGPWSVEAGGPGFSTQDYVSALSDIRAA